MCASCHRPAHSLVDETREAGQDAPSRAATLPAGEQAGNSTMWQHSVHWQHRVHWQLSKPCHDARKGAVTQLGAGWQRLRCSMAG